MYICRLNENAHIQILILESDSLKQSALTRKSFITHFFSTYNLYETQKNNET